VLDETTSRGRPPRPVRRQRPAVALHYKRWKKTLDQIMSWDRFEPADFMTEAQIDEWVKTTRHKVMYRDESKVD
jgi:hypothetical protein